MNVIRTVRRIHANRKARAERERAYNELLDTCPQARKRHMYRIMFQD